MDRLAELLVLFVDILERLGQLFGLAVLEPEQFAVPPVMLGLGYSQSGKVIRSLESVRKLDIVW